MDTVNLEGAEQTRKTYENIAEKYDERYKGPIWDVYDGVTLSGIRSVLPGRSSHVLDAGAGTGRFSLHIAKMGHTVTLLDPSQKMLGVARDRFEKAGVADQARFAKGSIENLEFPDDTFDAVVCEGDPLSYCLETHGLAARELLRVLAPGHQFYVSCDNRWPAALGIFCRDELEKFEACAVNGDSNDPYGLPVHAFRPSGLKSLFEGAGALDVQVSGKVVACNFLPPQRITSMIEKHGLDQVVAYENRFGSVPSLIGMAGHLVAVGRKSDG